MSTTTAPVAIAALPQLRFAAGELIHRAGDLAGCLFLLESGCVELTLPLADGAEWRLIEVVDGELFGEVDVIEATPRTVNARAVTDCELRALTLEQLEEWLRRQPEVALQAIASMARQVRALQDRLRSTASQLATARALADATGSTARPDRRTARLLPGEDSTQPERVDGEQRSALSRLVHKESGKVLAVPAGGNLLIGRSSADRPGKPELDLAPFDLKRTVSRRHARLLKRDGRWRLHAESKAMNGTRVNGTMLAVGDETELEAGDVLTFGSLDFVFLPGTA